MSRFSRRNRKLDPLTLAFFLGAIAVVSTMFTLHYLGQMYLGWSSRQWPTAQARVLTAKETQERLEPAPYGKRKRRKKDRYEVHQTFAYKYEAEGGSYFGEEISFPPSQKLNVATIQEYPEGTSFEVRYHPDEPSLSVVVPGTPEGAGTQLAWRLIVNVGPGLLGFFFWRRFRQNEDRLREARFAP